MDKHISPWVTHCSSLWPGGTNKGRSMTRQRGRVDDKLAGDSPVPATRSAVPSEYICALGGSMKRDGMIYHSFCRTFTRPKMTRRLTEQP